MQNVSFNEALDAVVAGDARYDREAYIFLRDSLEFTLKRHRKTRKEEPSDVPAQELLEGFRLYALKEYGPMARMVLDYWGVRSCEDIGHLVFNLVQAGIFSKTDRDTLEEFRAGFDFDAAFVAPFRPAKKTLSNAPASAVQPGS